MPTRHRKRCGKPASTGFPPRNWDATSLWVTKNGVIGHGKHLWLRSPMGGPNAQSDDRGRVALRKPSDGPAVSDMDWIELLEGDFTAPAHAGEQTAQIMIRGHLEATTVYQTKPEHAGKLILELFISPDKDKWGERFYWTEGFSVAAIPTHIVGMNMKPFSQRVGNVMFRGMIIEKGVTSDSEYGDQKGSTTYADLSEISLCEVIKNLVVIPADKPQQGAYFSVPEIAAGTAPVDKVMVAIHFKVFESPQFKQQAEQAHIFRDARTGAKEIPITYSGFEILKERKAEPTAWIRCSFLRRPRR